MNVLDGPHFKINKLAAKACGVWPYQSGVKNFLHFSFFILTVFPFLFALFAGLMQEWSTDFIIILETVIILVFVSAGTINGIILYIQKNQTKILYERISIDWKNLSDEAELRILDDHTRRGRKYTIMFIKFISLVFLVSTAVVFAPRLLDPSRPFDRAHSFPYYYHRLIIDDRFYHHQVLGHYTFAIIYVSFAYTAFSRTFIASVRHVCGLFAIARHRLENVTGPARKHVPDGLMDDKQLVQNLIQSTYQHKKAIDCLQLIEKIFNAPLFVTELMDLACIAIFIFDIKYHQNHIPQLVRLLFMVLQFIIYLLFFNAAGQQVLDSCDKLFKTAYFVEWYRMPILSRKLLLVIMIRAAKGNHLTAGSLVILSMENYAKILKTSWSFATVLLTAFNKKQG